MPPQRPDFLPNNRFHRQRNLDPTRQLTSRELWNQVRFHSTPSPGDAAPTNRASGGYYQSLMKAILYEIQPFRVKPTFRRLRVFLLEEDGFKQTCVYCIERVKSILLCTLSALNRIYQFLKSIDVKSIQSFVGSKFFRYSAITCVGLYIYGRVLAYLHEWLHAGPMVFILTLLVLLYTIGLGENTGAASGVPSAYSVFNRGIQRLLGQEDAETLANQFARAAAGRGLDAGGAGRNNNAGLQVGQIWVDNGEQLEDEADNEQEVANERRRRRRLERLQRRNNDNADDASDVQEVNGSEIESEQEAELPQNVQNGNTVARKSGKKARRRNLELRREMQRQRQAAAAMGFGDDGNGGVNLREMNAMDQLIDND